MVSIQTVETSMKRFKIDIEITYGTGYYDGDEYSDLRVKEDKNGDWCKAKDVGKLLDRVKRMQARIDKLEGRNV